MERQLLSRFNFTCLSRFNLQISQTCCQFQYLTFCTPCNFDMTCSVQALLHMYSCLLIAAKRHNGCTLPEQLWLTAFAWQRCYVFVAYVSTPMFLVAPSA